MENSKQKNILKIIFKKILFLIPVVVTWIIFKFFIILAVVQSGSMEPTLMTGNTVLYNRFAYSFKEIQRGDLIIFKSQEFGEKYLGKRVIGLPGDHLEFKDGEIYVNGSRLDESRYLDENTKTYCKKSFNVPNNSYFLLGDNREWSLDSRSWNRPYISSEEIEGKYIGQVNFSIQYDIINPIRNFLILTKEQ